MVFSSNTLDVDYNNSPSDAQSASNAWSVSSSTVTDTETDNDAGLPGTGSPRTDYQADPNTNIYTQHRPYINKLTVDIDIDSPVLQNLMKIVGYQIFLWITTFVILVIRPDYQTFCLRSTPGSFCRKCVSVGITLQHVATHLFTICK